MPHSYTLHPWTVQRVMALMQTTVTAAHELSLAGDDILSQ